MFQVIETDIPGSESPDLSTNPIVKASAERAAIAAMKGAKEIADLYIAQVEAKLAGIKPKTAIIGVTVNGGAIVKLKTEAAPCLPDLIMNAKLGFNSLLVGPAGCGKTHAAAQLAEALRLAFYHVSFTAGASETWLYGRQTPTGFVPGPLHLAAKNGGVLLGDELDAADANMALCLNTLLANGHIYNPINGETIAKHKDFVFVGTANTFGKGGNGIYTGRNRLDAATLDRFVTLKVTYDSRIEDVLCPNEEIRAVLRKARAKLESLNSQEFISYRKFEQVFGMVSQGMPIKQAIETAITASWADEIAEACFPAKAFKAKKTDDETPKAERAEEMAEVETLDTGAGYEPF